MLHTSKACIDFFLLCNLCIDYFSYADLHTKAFTVPQTVYSLFSSQISFLWCFWLIFFLQNLWKSKLAKFISLLFLLFHIDEDLHLFWFTECFKSPKLFFFPINIDPHVVVFLVYKFVFFLACFNLYLVDCKKPFFC